MKRIIILVVLGIFLTAGTATAYMCITRCKAAADKHFVAGSAEWNEFFVNCTKYCR